MMKTEKYRKILIVVIILTLAFIWGNSVLDNEQSSSKSGFVVEFLELIFGSGNVDEHIVRKIAHFLEYALLGFELMLYFSKLPMAAAHGLIASFFDETLQYFSPGRSAEVKDMWIDFAGACAGALFAVILVYIINNLKNKD